MSNEEIVKEIDKATNLMTEAKVKMNVALNLARGVIMKGNTVDTEAYNKGLEDGRNDAWKLANKIADTLTTSERAKIFGYVVNGITVMDILRDFTPQEALVKLEAYEKEQNEIKVGDIVYNDDTMEKGVVTHIDNDEVFMLYDDGSCGNTYGNLTKTGKHIDIQSLLEQIKE